MWQIVAALKKFNKIQINQQIDVNVVYKDLNP